jgi:hypothetical protein
VTPWLLGAGGVLAALAAVAAAAIRLRRRTPRVPLRFPVAPGDQEAVRGLVAGERRVDAVELLRRRYRLDGDEARAVADDVAAHADYPADWPALAGALDDELREEIRRLVRSGRRPAAVRLVRLRFGLPPAVADELVRALTQESPPGEA